MFDLPTSYTHGLRKVFKSDQNREVPSKKNGVAHPFSNLCKRAEDGGTQTYYSFRD